MIYLFIVSCRVSGRLEEENIVVGGCDGIFAICARCRGRCDGRCGRHVAAAKEKLTSLSL